MKRDYDLNYGCLGNGLVVWNRLKEVSGDYEKIAHIDRNRQVKLYKKLPYEVEQEVRKISQIPNPIYATSQPDVLVFNE